MGVALLTSQGIRRPIVVGLAGLAVITGLAALASELLDLALDESIAASALALLTGQMALSRHGRAPAAMTFWIGVGTLPALTVGGALTELDEQLLKIPLGCLGTRLDAGGLGYAAELACNSCIVLMAYA